MKKNQSHIKTILITVTITIVVMLSIFYFIGQSKTPISKDKGLAKVTVSKTSKTSEKNLTDTTQISTTKETTSSTTDESSSETVSSSEDIKHLTTDQVYKWVEAVMEVVWQDQIGFEYVIEEPVIDPNDGLLYVTIAVPQLDNYGTLRITENGELEGIRGFSGSMTEWALVSKKYMDVDTIKEKRQQQEQDRQKAEQLSQQKEDDYYRQIVEAKEKQQAYIDSFDDPDMKNGVQSSTGAARAKAEFLKMDYPDDTSVIDRALKRVIGDPNP